MRPEPQSIACPSKHTKPPRLPSWLGANGTIMAFGNALATASGRKLAGVSLRVLGLPDLLDTPGSAPTLAIDLTRGPSLAIVVDGVVHRVGAASDDLEDVERETIRLVSAWRMTEDSPVEEIVVSGQQELADHLVGRLRSALGLSVHSVVAPLDTSLAEDLDHPPGTPWGLVGLGRAHLLSHERIDLQHPRVPEDRAAPLKRARRAVGRGDFGAVRMDLVLWEQRSAAVAGSN